MFKLPQFQMADKDLSLLQTTWAAIIQPVVSRAQNSSVILEGVELSSGDNVIKHTLNRELKGWRIVRIRAAATIYDKQDDNGNPVNTLVLNSSAAVTIDLEVF